MLLVEKNNDYVLQQQQQQQLFRLIRIDPVERKKKKTKTFHYLVGVEKQC